MAKPVSSLAEAVEAINKVAKLTVAQAQFDRDNKDKAFRTLVTNKCREAEDHINTLKKTITDIATTLDMLSFELNNSQLGRLSEELLAAIKTSK